MSLPLILITGATGFIGSHVLHQALDAGYPVRITVRPAKLNDVRVQYGDSVEVMPIEDIATGDYTEALKGVAAIVHVAGPLRTKAGPEALVDGAINGTLNILRHAAAAGIHKVILTSSFVTTMPDIGDFSQSFTDHVYTGKEWNDATLEQALDGTRSPFWIYGAAKSLAEKEIWKLAGQHRESDYTTIHPPFVYGPLAPGYHVSKGDIGKFSSDALFYFNVLPRTPTKLPPTQTTQVALTVDVRDVAKAHILALKAPPTSEVGQKRLLVSGPNFSWKDAVEHLAVVRPELKDRLSDSSEAQKMTIATVDTTRASEVLGMTTYIDWKKTVEDTADSLLAVEKSWGA